MNKQVKEILKFLVAEGEQAAVNKVLTRHEGEARANVIRAEVLLERAENAQIAIWALRAELGLGLAPDSWEHAA